MMSEWYWVENGDYLGIKTQQYGDDPAEFAVHFTGADGVQWGGTVSDLFALLRKEGK